MPGSTVPIVCASRSVGRTIITECADAGFMAGVKIDDHTIMLAVTEQRTKEEIDELVETIKQIREDAA